MSDSSSDERATVPSLHPVIARLIATPGVVELGADAVEAFVRAPGAHVLVFTEDPARYRETLDLAVIVPELARAFSGAFDVGVLLPEAARAVQARFAFRRWPAVVMVRDGEYIGAIDGLRGWEEYLEEMKALLGGAPRRPPTIGIRVAAGPNPDTNEDRS